MERSQLHGFERVVRDDHFNMDRNQLIAFMRIVREGSFNRAAWT